MAVLSQSLIRILAISFLKFYKKGSINAFVMRSRYIAMIEAGASDYRTKIAENEMAIMPIKRNMEIGTLVLFMAFMMRNSLRG